MSLIDSNRNQPQKEIALFGDYIPQKQLHWKVLCCSGLTAVIMSGRMGQSSNPTSGGYDESMDSLLK
jgi:hypothetical protein